MAFQFDETIFYVVVWMLGFLSSSIRVIRDHSYNGIGDCLSIGMSGGFFSFGVICILLRYDPVSDGNRFFYLGIASLVGLLGKEQDIYLRIIIKKVFKTIGVTEDQDK